MLTIDEIIEDLSFLESWEERLRYIVELGRELEPMCAADQVDGNRMSGCQSRVWIKSQLIDTNPPQLKFSGASDAQIVRGLIYLIFSIVNYQSPQYILNYDIAGLFHQLQLENYLTPSRANGLRQLVDTVKNAAVATSTELERADP